MVDTELYRVLRHRQSAAQEFHVTHPQCHRFAPPDAGVRQQQHQGAVLAGFIGEPCDVVGG
jgi:hypothetical protein